MASTEPDQSSVHPLRISKVSATGSPTKLPRPLSEVAPSERRRNSPSWNAINSKHKISIGSDSSPFQSSPFEDAQSRRHFWESRSKENSPFNGSSPSPRRRTSIEQLERASRVKNSNILALEHKNDYDPANVPMIERPLAKPMRGNAFGSGGNLNSPWGSPERKGHQRAESKVGIPYSPTTLSHQSSPRSLVTSSMLPSRDQVSPTKPALVAGKFKTGFDENDMFSGDDRQHLPLEERSPQRLPKSVTFDAAPPQINEYEMVTPDISSIGGDSYEGSYDYDDELDEEDFYVSERNLLEDSFDASLEDTDKTPVVGPDDWRHESADNESFDDSIMPEDLPRRVVNHKTMQQQQHRIDSVTSVTDHRPLPPLPGHHAVNLQQPDAVFGERQVHQKDDMNVEHRTHEEREREEALVGEEGDEDEDVDDIIDHDDDDNEDDNEDDYTNPESGLGTPKLSAYATEHKRFTPDGMPLTKPEYDGTGWGDDDEFVAQEEEPGTPDSVIHHELGDDDLDELEEGDFMDDDALEQGDYENERYMDETPAIPERQSTIKTPGGKLKARVSATPSDLAAMREQRRQVSNEAAVPPIPEHLLKQSPSHDDFLERHPSFKTRSLTLDLMPGLSLDQDFDRVMETQKVEFQKLYLNRALREAASGGSYASSQKDWQFPHEAGEANRRGCGKQRGYLMRQNTKIITASDKETAEFRAARSAGNSPIKRSPSRAHPWTVEPWNPTVRRRSNSKKPGVASSVSGQDSSSQTLTTVDEDGDETTERGRLFIKVLGVKELDLPLPKNERTWFSLTLDNGVHCVTTAWLELARNAPIGQEFELVVPNDLEFQLTLNVKLEKPEPVRIHPTPIPPPAPRITKHKSSTFSRVFGSPRKRREKEAARAREEEERFLQQQRESEAMAAMSMSSRVPTTYDLLAPLAADDGSFARAYICLKEHEAHCFGRPYVTEVACFNEWATEEAAFVSSVKSKRGDATVVRRAPYKIGKLELQLLFVPRPKGASDEDMPKSMNACIREMKATEERFQHSWEGVLSQQGGDCPYWRRRFFKLAGTKLTAYHESTRQPRATINLANAKALIDDRRKLTDPSEIQQSRNGQRRRRSGFAEDEEGYMFVEEGFRIRFNNGEVIDFYADTALDKEGWMRVLSEVIGRERDDDQAAIDDVGGRTLSTRRRWCEMVLRREEALRKRAVASAAVATLSSGEMPSRKVSSRPMSMYM